MKQVLNNSRFTQLIALGLTKKALFILFLSVPLALFSQKSKQNPLVGRWVFDELVLDMSLDFDCQCDSTERADLEEGFKEDYGNMSQGIYDTTHLKLVTSYMDFGKDSVYVSLWNTQKNTSTYVLSGKSTIIVKEDPSSFQLKTKVVNGKKRQFILLRTNVPITIPIADEDEDYGRITLTFKKMEVWFALMDDNWEPNNKKGSCSMVIR